MPLTQCEQRRSGWAWDLVRALLQSHPGSSGWQRLDCLSKHQLPQQRREKHGEITLTFLALAVKGTHTHCPEPVTRPYQCADWLEHAQKGPRIWVSFPISAHSLSGFQLLDTSFQQCNLTIYNLSSCLFLARLGVLWGWDSSFVHCCILHAQPGIWHKTHQ